ncbi:MAG: hypothetical protein ACK4NC_06590 [Candidatus Gracilibacteria bacterium]
MHKIYNSDDMQESGEYYNKKDETEIQAIPAKKEIDLLKKKIAKKTQELIHMQKQLAELEEKLYYSESEFLERIDERMGILSGSVFEWTNKDYFAQKGFSFTQLCVFFDIKWENTFVDILNKIHSKVKERSLTMEQTVLLFMDLWVHIKNTPLTEVPEKLAKNIAVFTADFFRADRKKLSEELSIPELVLERVKKTVKRNFKDGFEKKI